MNESSQQQQTTTILEVYRLMIKNIPDKISNDTIMDILKKNFEDVIFDISINKLKHKYNNMKNKKTCFLSTNSLNIRKKIIDFFYNYEFIDPKGLKFKFTVVDSLYQPPMVKSNDKAENTIYTSKLILFFFLRKLKNFHLAII
jgi:hypothetical protein